MLERCLTTRLQTKRSTSQKAKRASQGRTVFECGAMKYATQLTKTLEEIADYIKIKYNSDVTRMIRDVE